MHKQLLDAYLCLRSSGISTLATAKNEFILLNEVNMKTILANDIFSLV